MSMKSHILAALSEELEAWEALLAELNEEQITAPMSPSHWSIKDVVAHVMAWQQRSIARVAAALSGEEPQFPGWPTAEPDSEETTEQTNAWIYQTYRHQPWPRIHRSWRAGFQRFLQLSAQVSERDLLDSGRYSSWLDGHPLAFILIASYDHHQEHLEKTQAWLREHGHEHGHAHRPAR
jgi:hypothetical protein